jgi:hypothetical protein
MAQTVRLWYPLLVGGARAAPFPGATLMWHCNFLFHGVDDDEQALEERGEPRNATREEILEAFEPTLLTFLAFEDDGLWQVESPLLDLAMTGAEYAAVSIQRGDVELVAEWDR